MNEDVSAFGVIHKSTRRQRQNRRVATGMAAGTAVGAAGGAGLAGLGAYSDTKWSMRNNHEYAEEKKAYQNRSNYNQQRLKWLLNGGAEDRFERVWEPGSTGEKFESPKQAQRVQRLRNLANHPSSKGTPEGDIAAERLKSMGFSTEAKETTPGGWRVKRVPGAPEPQYKPYHPKPWKNPGKKVIWNAAMKRPGTKLSMAATGLAGAFTALPVGMALGIRHHQKKEGIGPYKNKRR